MKTIKQKIKQIDGFTPVDIAISVVIIVIFIGLIATLFYNFYLTANDKNRNAMATNCLIDIIEEVKKMDYDQLNTQEVDLLLSSLRHNKTIPNGFTVFAKIQKYNEIEGNEQKLDVIKILQVKVEYRIGQKIQNIEVSTLITK